MYNCSRVCIVYVFNKVCAQISLVKLMFQMFPFECFRKFTLKNSICTSFPPIPGILIQRFLLEVPAVPVVNFNPEVDAKF